MRESVRFLHMMLCFVFMDRNVTASGWIWGGLGEFRVFSGFWVSEFYTTFKKRSYDSSAKLLVWGSNGREVATFGSVGDVFLCFVQRDVCVLVSDENGVQSEGT